MQKVSMYLSLNLLLDFIWWGVSHKKILGVMTSSISNSKHEKYIRNHENNFYQLLKVQILATPKKLLLIMQIQAWQDEVDRARQGQRDAAEKVSSMEVRY